MTLNESSDPSGYGYGDADASHTHAYLWSPVKRLLDEERIGKLFDLGCGNGAFAFELAENGIEVVGVDPSEDGINQAQLRKENRKAGPELHLGNAYDDLAASYGRFPCVVSLEVVEHVYFPRKYAKCVRGLLEPGGMAIISTPYHGYWKNLALALTGKFDEHFTALWDHGHIKFWSVRTLSMLFEEQGLQVEKVIRVGRFPTLAKSMILVIRRK